MEKNTLFFLAFVFVLGLIFKIIFFNSTDVTWDEAFHFLLAFKMALMPAFPLVLLALIGGFLVFFWISFIKKNFKAVFLIVFVGVISRLVIDFPVVFHPRHPPFYNVIVAIGIFFTSLPPDFVAKSVSFLSILAMPFIGFFLIKKLLNENAGVFVFALLSLSPLGLFFSSTAIITPFSTMLAFSAILFFFAGLKDSKNLVLSGIIFALAIASRYTVLMFLPFFVLLLFLNRKKLLSKENKNNSLIFLTIVFGALLFFAPNILHSFQGFLDWDVGATNNIYVRDIEHYSFYFSEFFGGEPLTPQPDFYLLVFGLFFSVFSLVIFVFGAYKILHEKKVSLIFFPATFLAFFAFFSFQSNFQVLRYAVEFAFLFIFVIAVGLSRIRIKYVAKILLSLLLLLFVFQSIVIINEHKFHGLSQTFAEISPDAKIMTNFLDPVRFYSGDYLDDSQLNNKFFSNFFGLDEKKEQRIFYFTKQELGDIQNQIDVVLVDKVYFDNGFTEEEILNYFEKCSEIKESGQTIFWFYAKNCP